MFSDELTNIFFSFSSTGFFVFASIILYISFLNLHKLPCDVICVWYKIYFSVTPLFSIVYRKHTSPPVTFIRINMAKWKFITFNVSVNECCWTYFKVVDYLVHNFVRFLQFKLQKKKLQQNVESSYSYRLWELMDSFLLNLKSDLIQFYVDCSPV